MKLINLYTGFELDRELVFTERNKRGDILFKINLWYGYFDSIMRLIPLSQDLDRTSIYYNWHNITGFYDDLWECENVNEFSNQLVNIEFNLLSEELKTAINALKQICDSVSQNKNLLFIEYF